MVSANTDGSDMAGVIRAIRAELADRPMPDGYFTSLEGQFQAQEQATGLIGALALVSLSTTLATNALVEGQGGRVALIFVGFDDDDLELEVSSSRTRRIRR